MPETKSKGLTAEDAAMFLLLGVVAFVAINMATQGQLARFVRMSLIPGPVTPEAEAVLFDETEAQP